MKTVYKERLIMEKIKMSTPLVEMDGDEMTRILWKIIKDELLVLPISCLLLRSRDNILLI